MSKYKLPEHVENEGWKYKNVVMRYPTRKVVSKAINDTLAVDLADYSNEPSGNYKYVMLAIELVSRKIYYALLTNKSVDMLKKGLNTIFTKCRFVPRKIWSDRETGLLSYEMKEYFSRKHIVLYHTFGEIHNPVAERAIRTIKTQIAKTDDKFTKNIKFIVDNYNETVHSSTRETPNDVQNDPNAANEIIQKMEKAALEPKQITKFNIGDKVRISIQKRTFTKGYKQKWSDEIFIVYEVVGTHPQTYKLLAHDGIVDGSFYNESLQKVSN